MAEVVAFDSLGTLFDLGNVSDRMPRVLHHAAALTLIGEWAEMSDVARSVDPELVERLSRLDAHEDARAAFELLRSAGRRVSILTNGGRDSTVALLERNDLAELVDEVHTVAEVRAYKPHPSVYELLPRGATLVAAHGWDVAGARAAGYRAVWVDRDEKTWRFPLPEPELRAHDLVGAARLAVAAV